MLIGLLRIFFSMCQIRSASSKRRKKQIIESSDEEKSAKEVVEKKREYVSGRLNQLDWEEKK